MFAAVINFHRGAEVFRSVVINFTIIIKWYNTSGNFQCMLLQCHLKTSPSKLWKVEVHTQTYQSRYIRNSYFFGLKHLDVLVSLLASKILIGNVLVISIFTSFLVWWYHYFLILDISSFKILNLISRLPYKYLDPFPKSSCYSELMILDP